MKMVHVTKITCLLIKGKCSAHFATLVIHFLKKNTTFWCYYSAYFIAVISTLKILKGPPQDLFEGHMVA